VFHARFVDHAYPPHTHDSWTVFIVDEGAVRYDLETQHRGAAGPRITLLPPHVVHDGRAATTSGYSKRVLYVESDVLPETLIGASVDRPDIEDAAVVRSVLDVHRAVQDDEHEPLGAEGALAVMGQRLRRHLDTRASTPVERPEREVAAELRDLLDEHRFDRVTLADAARRLHVSPGHLVRSFTRAFGIAPHRYVIARRIDAARARLLDGEPIADVAASVGFHDQAHLTRHFRRHVGTTPGRFATSRTS
jgi:AraC-like DNA-binding protein